MAIESSSANINALFKQEKWAKAKKLIEKELAKTPDSHWLLDCLSVVHYEQRQYNEANFHRTSVRDQAGLPTDSLGLCRHFGVCLI